MHYSNRKPTTQSCVSCVAHMGMQLCLGGGLPREADKQACHTPPAASYIRNSLCLLESATVPTDPQWPGSTLESICSKFQLDSRVRLLFL